MKKIFKSLIPIFLFSFIFITSTSCSPSIEETKKPTFIVTVSPYNVWLKAIVGDTAEVVCAIPPKFNPHVYEATPKEMDRLKNATLWFTIGDPVEKKLEATLSKHYKNLKSIDLSTNLPLKKYYSTPPLFESSCQHHGHDHHDTIDRHFWLSPFLALLQCEQMTNTLVELYPQYSEMYLENFTKLRMEFENLIKFLTELLLPVKNKAFLISHSALGYFAQDFQLIQIPIECEGKSPRPKDLQKIHNLSKIHDVLCAFTLEKFDNKGTIAIAKDLNIPVYKFDPHSPDYFKSLSKLSKELVGE